MKHTKAQLYDSLAKRNADIESIPDMRFALYVMVLIEMIELVFRSLCSLAFSRHI